MSLKIDSAKHLFKEHFEDCEYFFGLVIANFGISHAKKKRTVFYEQNMLGMFFLDIKL